MCVPTAVTTSTPVVVNGRTGTHVLVWPDLFDLAARVVGFADAESSVVDIRAQLLTIPSGATEMVAVTMGGRKGINTSKDLDFVA